MECNFVVGQRVVCINDVWTDTDVTRFWDRLPELNEIVTIREIFSGYFDDGREWVGVRLVEIKGKQSPFHGEIGFAYNKFRPLHETDISIFTEMLAPVTEKVGA